MRGAGGHRGDGPDALINATRIVYGLGIMTS